MQFDRGSGGRRLGAAASVLLAALAAVPGNAATIRGGDPGKWGSPVLGTGASILWSIMGGGLQSDFGLTVDPGTILPDGYESEISGAFSTWSAVADLSFPMAADPRVGWLEPGAGVVDIRIGFRPFDGPSGNLGFGYFPLASNGAGAGDIFIDSDDTWTLGSGPGFSLRRIMVHEIGHSLGLDHSFGGTAMFPFYGPSWEAPQPDDIEGARFLYGPPQVIPAPASAPLLAGGLVLLYLRRRRRA